MLYYHNLFDLQLVMNNNSFNGIPQHSRTALYDEL